MVCNGTTKQHRQNRWSDCSGVPGFSTCHKNGSNTEILKTFFTNKLTINLKTKFESRLKTEFARGPSRGDTCHLSNLDETLPD